MSCCFLKGAVLSSSTIDSLLSSRKAILDAIFGLGLNSFFVRSSIVEVIFLYGSLTVFSVSLILWAMNLFQLNDADINKEMKSKWRHYMFLTFILSNAPYYEEFVAKSSPDFKKLRNLLALNIFPNF